MKLALMLFAVSLFAQAPTPAPSGALDYSMFSHGPKTVHVGSELWINLFATYPGGNPTKAHLFFTAIENVPANATAESWCNNAKCWYDEARKQFYQYQGTNKTSLRLITTAATPPGAYVVTVRTDVAGVPRSVNVPINVVAVPDDPVVPTPVTVPVLDSRVLKKWETTMLQLGNKWCTSSNPSINALSFGVESQVWYYDGARVMFQLADYTKDPKWDTCALSIARQYRNYLVSNKGNILGSRSFPHGLAIAYARTRDPSFRDAVLLMALKGPWSSKGGDISEQGIRETAFLLQAQVAAEKLGFPRDPMMQRTLDFLLGHFDILFRGTPSLHQTFFDGLAAHALIDYYELTQDPRVPPAIGLMLDWIWVNAWDAKAKALMINPEPKDQKCGWGCRQPNTDLINLTAPAYAWYGRLIGNPAYIAKGDEMFRRSLDSDISYSGKIFSQNFRWSYPLVRQ